jgi:polar amino acid transport system substrate-binding protein
VSRLAALALVLAAVAAAAVAAAPPPTLAPGRLTVGIDMPSEGFQVGVADGARVLYARGLEIDLARALAARLGLRRTTFVQSRFDRLFSAGPKPWDVALAEITITPERRRTADFSVPYMSVDQGVLAAQTLSQVPTTIAGLRPLRICAMRKTTGQAVAQRTIAPTRPVRLVANVPTLMLDLQTGLCDAVVYDAPALGTLRARAPQRYGPFVGVIPTREDYGIALPRGSALTPQVNRALRSLLADGTVARLARKWLTVDPDRLPVLR